MGTFLDQQVAIARYSHYRSLSLSNTVMWAPSQHTGCFHCTIHLKVQKSKRNYPKSFIHILQKKKLKFGSTKTGKNHILSQKQSLILLEVTGSVILREITAVCDLEHWLLHTRTQWLWLARQDCLLLRLSTPPPAPPRGYTTEMSGGWWRGRRGGSIWQFLVTLQEISFTTFLCSSLYFKNFAFLYTTHN